MCESIEKVIKDRPFNPNRLPRTENASLVIEHIISQVLSYEESFKLRKRKRKQEDMQSFRKIITAICCDLIHNQFTSPEKPIYISLSKRILGLTGRYTSPIMAKVLPDILERLAAPEMAFVLMEKGHRGFERKDNKRTTIAAGASLLTLIFEHKLSLEDFTIDINQETIILKSTKESVFDKGEWIDYVDTEFTIRCRSDLLMVNRWLRDADINCDEAEADVDTSDRFLKRYFSNNSFESCGRLYGGFWQLMKKVKRKSALSINDEPIVALDYSQAVSRIAYGVVNATPPIHDSYELPSGKYDRNDIKKIFSAMIYADHPLTRFPKDTRKNFEMRVSFSEVRDEIVGYHQPISHLFGTGIGLKLMYTESQILISALLECMRMGIVALPVHDALIVAESDKEQVTEIMLTSFRRFANVEGKVDEE